jgi:hypothetical protein
MNAIRNVALAVVLSTVAALSSAAPAHAAPGDTFAAIAFSPNTGHYGYAYGAQSQSRAELRALSECDRDDGQVLVVVKNGYAALVVGADGSYGYAWGSSQDIAEGIALRKCLDAGGVRPRIVVSISSDD